ncbi:MAG: hypothetical protein K6E85_01895 [Lachnospiraceae bacterium]|nr:hypothetical protein [Lachnospiraceae bacterium]
MSRPDEIYPRTIADEICNIFEDVLDQNGIVIPDPTRRPDDMDTTCLYGDTYFNVLDKVEGIVLQALTRMAEHPETVIVPDLYS